VTDDIDWSNGNMQEIDLITDPTFTFSNGVTGSSYTLLLRQTLVGRRTLQWSENVIFSTTLRLPNLRNQTEAGAVDTTFNTGTGFQASISMGPTILTTNIQQDGKIIVGGGFLDYNNIPYNNIVRLTENGPVDEEFITGTGFNSAVYATSIQQDGKIIVGGTFTSYDDIPANRIIRLNTNGSIDNTFNTGTGLDSDVFTIATQQDGKIIVGGNFTSYNGSLAVRITRLNTDGSIDNTFVTGTGFNSTVNTITLQSDGKILVGGLFTSFNFIGANRIIRLNTDGSIDNTFVTGTGFNSTVNTIILQSDGKIIVGGAFTSYNSTSRSSVARLNVSGSVDADFIAAQFSTSPSVWTLSVQTDGKIIVGGFFTGQGTNRIARLLGIPVPPAEYYTTLLFSYTGNKYIANNTTQ
jgi:uncharacterized delta-60 repeat protein